MMSTQSDSFEGDIWNYQPAVTKKREKSDAATYLKVNDKSSVRQEDKFLRKATNFSNCKGSSHRKSTTAVNHEYDKNNERLDEFLSDGKQVIDVDLECDSEFSYPKVQTGHSKCGVKSSSQMAEKSTQQNLSYSSPTIKQSLPLRKHPRSSKSVIGKRSFYSQSKSKPNSSSPAQKQRRISEIGDAHKKTISSIKTYFSPKKVNSIADTPNDPISISDDEFVSAESDIKVNGHENESTVSTTTKVKKTDFDNKERKAMLELDEVVGRSQAYEMDDEINKRNDICGRISSQSFQHTPSVDVNVVYDGESEQSSSEIEHRSALPLGKEIFERKQPVLEVSVIGSCDKSKDDTTSNYLTLFNKAEGNIKDESIAYSNEILSKSKTNDVESKVCNDDQFSNCSAEGGGFISEEGNINTEDYSNEIPNSNVRCCSVDAAVSDQKTSKKLLKFQTESGNRIEISNEKPTILLSSASWSSASTPATKQTTLFSFLKAKPGAIALNASADGHSGSSRQTFKKSNSMISLPSSSLSTASVTKTDQNLAAISDFPSTWVESFKGDGKKKACPFYKKIPGTSITVDAFRYGIIPGCEAYVLTHFHYDHYGGLTKKFSQPIFCSQVTGNLVESRIGVHKKWINCLPMWKPCKVAGVTLTLMEANHCPGAVIILFELNDGKKILHTGDFRASREMETYSALQGIRISELYLDTTYCNPSYAFPDQSEVVNFVVDLVLKHIVDHPSTLIICGAYTIGKERIFAAIAKSLDSKICVMNDKKKVLDCLEDADLKSRVTLDWSAGRVHVLPMGKLNQQQLKEHHSRHPHFKSVLAFQPTGWTHSDKQTSLHSLKPKWSKDGITLYGVPYSEHSSFLELKRFVQHFQPLKILPTVNNGNPASRSKMEAIFKEWKQEKMFQRI